MPTPGRIQGIFKHGQSVWLDYIERGMLRSGRLARLVEAGEISGVTSNPAIFAKAVSSSDAYDTEVREILVADPDASLMTIYEALAVEDIRTACDILMPVYDETAADDGYVSLEVSPNLAYDTIATVNEARRLFDRVARPNLMIKIPGADEGLPAITSLIADGVNVNVTLLFSVSDYEKAIEAYLDGLKECLTAGGDVLTVASVASFFVSRIDTAVDALLPEGSPLKGRAAIASARVAYSRFREVSRSVRFSSLQAAGARVQRLLFGSTSVKNPARRDVTYVEQLIGPGTVNTVPPATLDAFRDHGEAAETLSRGIDDAFADLEALEAAGVDLAAVTQQLQQDGVRLFSEAFDALMETLREKRAALIAR